MPLRILFLLSVWYVVFILSLSRVHAQAPPTPTDTPTPPSGASPTVSFADPTPGKPTCDLCGWCNPDPNAANPPNPTPANHVACMTCLYEADGVTEKAASHYTIIGCIATDKPGQLPQVFVRSVLTVVFGVAGGIAFMMFLYGASLVLTSSGDPLKLENGKDVVTSAIIGLLLVIFSVFLLRTIGFNVLQIPGFG